MRLVRPRPRRSDSGPAIAGNWLGVDGLRRLRAGGAAGCVLVGEPKYYERFGFVADDRLTFPGIPPEFFQALSFDCDSPTGRVAYHAAFG